MLIPREREKHLLFLVENKQKQIPLPPPRDRDDNRRALSISLFLKNVEKNGRALTRFKIARPTQICPVEPGVARASRPMMAQGRDVHTTLPAFPERLVLAGQNLDGLRLRLFLLRQRQG